MAESSDEAGGGSSVADTEDFSDISDDSDLFNISVKEDKTWTTRQDHEIEAIQRISDDLRDHPMLPPDPTDPDKDFTIIAAAIYYPPAHCAYRGCQGTQNRTGRLTK